MGQVVLKFEDPGTGPPETREGPRGDVAVDNADRDVLLMTRIRGRDERAYATLVATHFNAVFFLSRRMLGDAGEAEDVAQEVFLKVWTKADAWQANKARFTTWLHRVTSNACIDRLRKKVPVPIEEVPDYADPAASAERAISNNQAAARVEVALARLPDRQRLALVFTYYQGMSNKDAAEVMEISIEALESLLARARRSLKEMLHEEGRVLIADLEE